MAERAKPRLAARLARALDDRKGLSLVALDEGAGPEERIPEALADRLAIHLDLSDIPLSDAPDLQIDTDAIVEARRILPRVTVPDSTVSDLAQVAFRLGITSLGRPCRRLRWPAPVPRCPARPRWANPTS
jgi:magnesium chelatase subunit D